MSKEETLTVNEQEEFLNLDFDKGYFALPNKVLDLLSQGKIDYIDVTILVYIFRMTIGWKRNWAWISIALIHQNTNISLNTVRSRIKKLTSLALIFRADILVNNVNQTYIFINNKTTVTVVTKLINAEIPASYITGIANSKLLENNFVDKIKNIVSNTFKVLGTILNVVPPSSVEPLLPSSGEGNKNNIEKNIIKNKQTNVDVSFKNKSKEEEILKLLKDAKYNNKNIEFKESVAESLIRNYPIINGRKLIEVVKEKISYLEYETIDLNKYSPSAVLHNMIKEDRQPSKGFNEYLTKEVREKESSEWLPIMNNVFKESFNSVTKEEAIKIIRHRLGSLLKNYLEDNDSYSQKQLSYLLKQSIELTGKSLKELTEFSEDKLFSIINVVFKSIEDGVITMPSEIILLMKKDLSCKYNFNKLPENKEEKPKKDSFDTSFTSVANLISNLSNKFAFPNNNANFV